MKLKHLHHTLALGALLCGFAAASASAQTQTTYTPGDLFIGFRATSGSGSDQNYLVKIGPASQFRDAAPGSSFDLNSVGSIGLDLVATYGAGWASRVELQWSISGGNTSLSAAGGDPSRTAYYSVTEGGPAWTTKPSAGLAELRADLSSQASRYVQTQVGDPRDSTVNSPVGLLQNSSESNSYGSFQVQGSQINAYSTFGGGGEADFGAGVAGASLDLYRLAPGINGTPGELLGTFTISDLGVVTFTAIPEPGIIALLGIAGIAAGGVALRRRAQKSNQA